jgi:hypothetical protein
MDHERNRRYLRTPALPPLGVVHRHRLPKFSLTVLIVLLVLAGVSVVHWGNASALGKSRSRLPATIGDNANLPNLVSEMRETILSAVHRGQITDLTTALELNELKPDVSDEPVDDIIGYWRARSPDKSGSETLKTLALILGTKPAIVPLGRDIENNAIYVWPYLAEQDLSTLTPPQEAELAELVGTEKAIELKTTRRWSWYRLTIGADGTWHSFRLEN